MVHGRSLIFVCCLLSTAAVQAQMYKWVGADGKVTYSDVPPPASAKKLDAKKVGASASPFSGLPYELAEAARNHPVILYTGEACQPCNDGRTMLNSRGIPFTEKTVTSNDDLTRLRQISSDNNLPLLTVGRNKQKGFSVANWTTALDAAGYPTSSKLPKDFRNPVAVALAAPPPSPSPSEVQNTQTAGQPPTTGPVRDSLPASGNAPPGFRF